MYKPALLVAAITAVAEARQCTNIMVPVSLESRNGKFDVRPPETEIEATNFALELTRQGRNYTDVILDEVRFSRPAEVNIDT